MPYKKSTRRTHSGARNVYWDNKRGQWYVRITVDGLTYTAGRYFNEGELEEARQAAADLRRRHGVPDLDQPFSRA